MLTAMVARLIARFSPKLSPADQPLLADNNGRRGDGPPDLEELWQDFNRRLNRLLGGARGAGGGAGGTGGAGMRGAGIGAVAIAAMLVVLWIGSGFFIVQAGEAGVVMQFGAYKYTTGAGWQWRLPFPIQSNEIVNLSKVRSIEIGTNAVIRQTNLKDSSMLTEDENIIDVRFAVQYRVKDASDFLFKNAKPEETVKQAAETAVREIVGRNAMDFVLYEGREKISIDLSQSIQRILDLYKTGIIVTSVTVQNVQPPEQVQAAFDDAVKASQDLERQTNEGQAYANDVIPRARGDASRVIQEAEGYKARVVAQAEGDAQRFKAVQAEYAKAPAVTRDRMYLDTMQQIFSNSTKVLVDSRNGSNLLYLPLDKLVDPARSSQPASGSASSTAGTPNATVIRPPAAQNFQNPGDDRSRDAARSRDRDAR